MAKKLYYNVFDDIEKYPDAWAYMIVGGRTTGKTYGALSQCLERKEKFIFAKRTADDVKLMCSGVKMVKGSDSEDPDFSPFVPINRDKGCNIKAFPLYEGLGCFYDTIGDEKGKEVPTGAPIGNIIGLNVATKFKGFDMSDCNYLIFDEFIPRKWERINRGEGDLLMDLYVTVARDRIIRGHRPLKLLALANAVNISNPLSNTMEITDTMADMQIHGEECRYIEDRGIFIRLLQSPEDFKKALENDPVYKAMGHTAWGQMAYDNQFAYDDFTNVGKAQMKNYKPVCSFSYKQSTYYVYQNSGKYYICNSKYSDKNKPGYNLNLENDQKKFYIDFAIDLRNECIDGNVLFNNYSLYDLIVNYTKFFKLK